MMALIVLPGIFVLTYGISQYVYREETIIDRKSVLWRRRGLSGNREWRELISNYQGVLKEHQYWHGGHESTSRRSSHMVYSIRLTHPDPGKEIVLYRAESSMLVPPTDWAEKWKQYAARLQLPVLEKTEKGISSSDVNDLETPLVDKIREGKLKVATIDPNNVALGLMAELTRDDGMWIITCYSVWNAWKSIAGVIILTVGLTGAYSFKLIDPQIFRYFLWFIPVCVLAVSLSLRKQLAHPGATCHGQNENSITDISKDRPVGLSMICPCIPSPIFPSSLIPGIFVLRQISLSMQKTKAFGLDGGCLTKRSDASKACYFHLLPMI
jgi:hypothetical protein